MRIFSLANCAQCGTKLPSFTFGEASPYCTTCRVQIPAEPASSTYEALGTPATQSIPAKPALGTYALFAVNVAVFIAMVISGVSAIDPDTQQVLKWGADYGPYTLGGQYWRLLTAMFLHFGIIHIAANMWCLWSLGRLAEKLLGSVSLICIYLLTGFGSDLLSLSWDPMRVSAGASGAIFGIAGALIAVLQFANLGLAPETVSRLRGYVVRFALLNLFIGLKGHIDNMAHLGGLVTGLLIGFFLARTFNSPAEERPAQCRNIFAASTVVLLLLFVPVAKAKRYVVELEAGQAALRQENYHAAAEHLQKYTSARPDDYYGHFLLGIAYQSLENANNAAREYERGLQINPEDQNMQIGLAEVYVAQNKPEKALPLFRKNISDISKDADALYLYGNALALTNNLSEAETALRDSLQVDDKLIESHRLLSDVLLKEGKQQEARKEKQLSDLLQANASSGKKSDAKK